MQLNVRLSIAASIVVCCIITAILLCFYFVEKSYLSRIAVNTRVTDIEKLALISGEPGLKVTDYMRQVQKDNAVRYALLSYPDGRITSADAPPSLPEDVSRQALAVGTLTELKYRASDGKEIIEMTAPVAAAGKKIAVARIGYDKGRLERSIAGTSSRHTIRLTPVVVGIAAVGLFLLLWMIKRNTRSFCRLAQDTMLLRKGKISLPLGIDTPDEAGLIASEFNRMNEKLSEIDNVKEEFINTISHEFISPLSAIRGYVQSLQRGTYGKLPANQHDVCDIIMWNCERLNKFINDIIDVTRMNAGKLDLSPQTLDILALVQEILAALRPLAEELKISFVIDINPPLPKVYGDRELLGRALKDIICNAMKFTPAGKAVLITAKKDNETTIVMQIRDAGPGLSAEQITQVFEKFSPFAAPPQTSKKIKGTGLGLFLAKRIVEMHHGKIWAESAHETGTTVSVAIPRNNVR